MLRFVKLLYSAETERFNCTTSHNSSSHLTVGLPHKGEDLWVTSPKWGVTASPPYQAGQERIVRASALSRSDQLSISEEELVPNLISQKCPVSSARFPDPSFSFSGTIAIFEWPSSKLLRWYWSQSEVFSNSNLKLMPSGRDPLCELSESDFLVWELRSPSWSSAAALFTATKARVSLQITEMKVRRHHCLRPNRDNNRH